MIQSDSGAGSAPSDLPTIEDSVDDGEVLYRRVLSSTSHYRVDGGRVRLSATAFTDTEKRPSVDRSAICHRLDPSGPQWTQEAEENSVVQFDAKSVRAIRPESRNERGKVERVHGVDVVPRPLGATPEKPANPAHSQIEAVPDIQRRMAFRKLLEALARIVNDAGERGWAILPPELRRTNATERPSISE